jgi:hypothetical protein
MIQNDTISWIDDERWSKCDLSNVLLYLPHPYGTRTVRDKINLFTISHVAAIECFTKRSSNMYRNRAHQLPFSWDSSGRSSFIGNFPHKSIILVLDDPAKQEEVQVISFGSLLRSLGLESGLESWESMATSGPLVLQMRSSCRLQGLAIMYPTPPLYNQSIPHSSTHPNPHFPNPSNARSNSSTARLTSTNRLYNGTALNLITSGLLSSPTTPRSTIRWKTASMFPEPGVR